MIDSSVDRAAKNGRASCSRSAASGGSLIPSGSPIWPVIFTFAQRRRAFHSAIDSALVARIGFVQFPSSGPRTSARIVGSRARARVRRMRPVRRPTLRNQRRSSLSRPAILLLVSLSILAVTLSAHPQPQQRHVQEGRLDGVVYDATSRTPVAGATVTAALSSGGWSRSVTTDVSGRFSLVDVPLGLYRITASIDGYLPAEYGQMWPAGPARPFGATQARNTVTLALWRAASLAGRVLDKRGKGMPQVTVRLWPALSISLPNAAERDSPTIVTTTDDSGAFRFTNVRPARYYMGVLQSYRSSCGGAPSSNAANKTDCVAYPSRGSLPAERSPDESTSIYESTFYPGVTSWPEAVAVPVYPGEDRRDITLTLESRPSVIVAGTVSGPNGPQADVIVSLVRSGNDGLVITDELRHVSSISDREGRFSFAGVGPGSYDVVANYFPRTSTGSAPVRTTNEAGLPVIRGVVAGIAAPSEGNPVLQARVRFTWIPIASTRSTSRSSGRLLSEGWWTSRRVRARRY